MRFSLLLAALLWLAWSPAHAQLLSPDEFLPHKLGEQFTPHHLLVDYFKHVAAHSDRVVLKQYGTTNEGRPLLMAIVSTPENLSRLEEIRLNNLRRTGLVDGQPDPADQTAIVWLSFSVHGNEAAGSESSMGVLYELTRPDNAEAARWLQNTVVILDPSLNPDGYARYTHWYRGVSERWPNPDPQAREHHEPWPGGRVNHYLFDLNRDWAWATQVETRQRLEVYNQWMPHIHADLHEQGYNNPYYFAPAAQPYHIYITDFQGSFQVEIGRNHARYFDQHGWRYFTREVFDLLYPSYGDTYPTFNGAIGMTYEQAGHSRAGRAILMENGDTLTLADRIQHHMTTALSTVEVASREAARLTRAFADYFAQAQQNPPGRWKTFVVKADNPPAKLDRLTQLLDRHRIRYGTASAKKKLQGYDYATGTEGEVTVEPGDLVVSAWQPKGILTQVLFEPEPELVDSLTYDITAWALPYAHGLHAYALEQRVAASPGFEVPTAPRHTLEHPYAWLVPWHSLESARILAALLRRDLKVRFAEKAFTIDGRRWDAGTLAIMRADNEDNSRLEALVAEVAARFPTTEVVPVASGMVEEGSDFGSATWHLVHKPRIALVGGKGTWANAFGHAWYVFEQDLEYPVTVVNAEDLSQLDLTDFNLIVLPDGFYRLGDKELQALQQWLYRGGRLIVLGRANGAIAGKSGFGLQRADDKKNGQEQEQRRTARFEDRIRDAVSESIPGAVYRLHLDNSHPLGFGMPEHYFSLKTTEARYKMLDKGWNVGYIGDDPRTVGFVGWRLRQKMKNTLVFGVEGKGRGAVIYMIDNPLFRAFWEQGKLLFSNAVFFAGQ